MLYDEVTGQRHAKTLVYCWFDYFLLVILFASPFPAISPWGLAIPRVLEVGVAQVATEKLQASGARRYAAG